VSGRSPHLGKNLRDAPTALDYEASWIAVATPLAEFEDDTESATADRDVAGHGFRCPAQSEWAAYKHY